MQTFISPSVYSSLTQRTLQILFMVFTLPTSAQDVNEEDGGGGLAPVQERRRGHGARPDHGDQHVPDLLRVGTHGAVRGAVISAGIHLIPAQRPPV